ncbi:diguanylate cyclase [Paenibacillus sp. CC-CFT747]|nr:diguanylate cyclase [Paenibacillus sp. CC-CFT747]
MFYLMLVFSIVPLGLGLAIKSLFGNTRLSKSLFVFMVCISVWQMDVAILFANRYVSTATIDFLFRLFRFGTIMLPAALLYVTYVIYQEHVDRRKLSAGWQLLINRGMLQAFGLWCLTVYAAGWTSGSIRSFIVVQSDKTAGFLFPVYGDWSWLFKAHILFFFLAIGVCLHLSRKVTSGPTRSFLTLFGVTSIIAYTVGMVNMSPNSGLYPSSIAVLIFAIAVFTAFCVMHSRVVREMNHALFEQKEFLTRVIDSNPNLIYARNGEGRLTLANLSLARMLGRRKEEIIGRTPEELWGSPALAGQEAIDQPDNGAGQPNREERVTDAEGKERWLQTACVPIDISNTKQWLFVSNDITERKEFEKNITHLAYHDTLTGLPNRFSFHTDLVGLLSPPSRTVALLFLDLDRFKIINDTLGHSIGDLFLTAVADRLVFLMEDRGRVYRIGGDEFMVTLEDGGQEKAVSEAKRILDSFQRPFYVNEHELFTTTSIGISVSSDDGGTSSRL